MIYFRVWRTNEQEENEERREQFLEFFSNYIDMLIEEEMLEKDDPVTLTEKGLFHMDNAYSVGRISFVLLIKRLLKASHAKLVSLLSRGINIVLHPKNEVNGHNQILEDVLSFVTGPNIHRLKEYVDRRAAMSNSSDIFDDNIKTHLKEVKSAASKIDLSSL